MSYFSSFLNLLTKKNHNKKKNLLEEKMSGFNVEEMFIDAKYEIEKFAVIHDKETFYAFSIDAAALCLNSIEKFEITLNYYQEKYPNSYQNPEDVNNLKYNTGDWEYQGFYDLEDGFDRELYEEHYRIPFENSGISDDELNSKFKDTPYHKAMSLLLERLQNSGVFNSLTRTADFKVFLSEHNY